MRIPRHLVFCSSTSGLSRLPVVTTLYLTIDPACFFWLWQFRTFCSWPCGLSHLCWSFLALASPVSGIFFSIRTDRNVWLVLLSWHCWLISPVSFHQLTNDKCPCFLKKGPFFFFPFITLFLHWSQV